MTYRVNGGMGRIGLISRIDLISLIGRIDLISLIDMGDAKEGCEEGRNMREGCEGCG